MNDQTDHYSEHSAAACYLLDEHDSAQGLPESLAAAQVHATLALAAKGWQNAVRDLPRRLGGGGTDD